MCNPHDLHDKFTQFLFQIQTAIDIKKDLFPDPNHFIPPSPPFNFQELPEPPMTREEQKNTEENTSSKNIEIGKESNKEAETIEDKGPKENDLINNLKKETKPSKYNRKEKTQLFKSENAGKQEKENDDICPKCNHKKGRTKSRNVKKNDMKLKNRDDSDLSQRRQNYEKEIVKRFIKETPSADHFCNCSNHGVNNKTLKQRKVNLKKNLIQTYITFDLFRI